MQFIPNPLAGKIAELEAKPQVSEAAKAALEYALSHVPIGETGELHDSIYLVENENGYRIYVGTDHWVYVEFGTSEMAAQPFMRPAIDSVGLHR